MILLSLKDVQKSYKVGEEVVCVLRQVNLEVYQGEKVAILGPSGSGKTTLLNLISALDRPDAGKVFYLGKDVHALTEDEQAEYRLHEVGFIFQFYHLLPELTVLENVLLPGIIAKKDLAALKERAFELLAHLSLEGKAHYKVYPLSGGERQKVAIARALLLKPKLVLADEPTGNLDPHSAETVINLLFFLCEREGSTLILVTHNHELAKRCEKRYLLREGHLVEC
ncbi:MAG: ABC transporter ATP-binding protein [Thermodesulfobacterium sp.]|jgi:ABC-type lipoprotein export system ATPase subunit|nr:ABC transporter ATP-binding protein [Thermodesulfobacterium sp.]